MKPLSCAIIFLACIIAVCGATYEEIQTGGNLHETCSIFMFIGLIAVYHWWMELGKKERP
jgi:hypothetical protein